MAERREAHVVDIIPGRGEGESTSAASVASSVALKGHPLAEIAQSPGHGLLLKLWQREEDRLARRISATETQTRTAKRRIFLLCGVFVAFHGLFLAALFAGAHGGACGARRRWWVPCGLSLAASLAMVWHVQGSVRGVGTWERRLERERAEARAVAKCGLELRMKGASFDLSRGPAAGAAGRRRKGGGEEMRSAAARLCRRNAVGVGMVFATSVVVPACKFVLCG
ncbi:uncharacterized protein LOC144704647 [Wolffia australiana]